MEEAKLTIRYRNPSLESLFPRRDIRPLTQASTSRSTAHATAARSSLTALVKDLRTQERQVDSLRSALDRERTDHEKSIDDLKAAHAKDLAIVNGKHVYQLAEADLKHNEELTRVKLWCEMNRPRPNELSRILERQRRSALQAEMEKMKEQAQTRNLLDEAWIWELEREKGELEHRLAKVQRQWAGMAALFPD